MTAETRTDVEPAERDPLHDEGERIEALLDEVERMAGPQTWPLVEELVTRVVRLYAAGLERVLAHAHAHGVVDDALWDRLLRDEVVASLLVLHGLHPQTAAERIAKALDRVAPWLARHGLSARLVSVDGDRARVAVDVADASAVGPESWERAVSALERAVADAAPEIAGLDVEGVAPAPPAHTGLVQIGNLGNLGHAARAKDGAP